MPNARVGAMPQPSHDRGGQNSSQHGRGGMRPQSGITMEDLKKQTAMRLMAAQHHHQKHHHHQERHYHASRSSATQDVYYSSNYRGADPRQDAPAYYQHPRERADANTGWSQRTRESPQQARVAYDQFSTSTSHTSALHREQYEQEFLSSSYNDDASTTTTSTSSSAVLGGAKGSSTNRASIFGAARSSGSDNENTRKSRGPADGARHHNQRGRHRNQMEHNLSQSSTTRSRPHKLPHGLTVQELKEMTKARLAAEAEAAERQDAQSPPYAQQTPSSQLSSQQGNAPSQDPPQHSQHHRAQSQRYKQQGSAPGQQYNFPRKHSHGHSQSDYLRRNAESPSFSSVQDLPRRSPYQRRGSSNSGENWVENTPAKQQMVHSRKPTPSTWQENRDKASPSALGSEQRRRFYPNQQYESPKPSITNKPLGGGSDSQSLQPSHSQPQYLGSLLKPGHEGSLHSEQAQFDAFETASVTSHSSTIASDYLGSESTFRTTPNQAWSPYLGTSSNSTGNSAFLGRSRSYPSGPNLGSALESPSFETIVSPSSFSDALGTKPASSPLSLAHDDRTIMRTMTLPLFESSAFGARGDDSGSPSLREPSPTHRSKPSDSNTTDVIEGPPSLAKFSRLPFGAGAGGEMEESSKDRFLNPLPLNPLNRGQSGHGEIPNWVAESVLVTPQRESRKIVSRTSQSQPPQVSNKDSVFRSASIGAERFPPPFATVSTDAIVQEAGSRGDVANSSWCGPPGMVGQLGSASFGGVRSLPNDFSSSLSLHHGDGDARGGGVKEPSVVPPPGFSPMPPLLQPGDMAHGKPSDTNSKTSLNEIAGTSGRIDAPSSAGFSVKQFLKGYKGDSQKDKVAGRRRRNSRPGS